MARGMAVDSTMREIRTARLRMRPWTRADVAALHALW